jgi:ATP-dependent DNA ligase
VFEEYRHPDMISPSGHAYELDFFFPQLNIAVEYQVSLTCYFMFTLFQGQQHFRNVMHFHHAGTLDEGKSRDMTKSALCKQKGITLIEIPYWWDRSYESLAATVYSYRPDVFLEPQTGTPIPLTPNERKAKSSNEGTNLSNFSHSLDSATRRSLMTATMWEDSSMNPTGWWMTEKYDGMRLFWNGTEFYTRQGRKVNVPESITKSLPSVALDGELWTQYGLFQDVVNLSKSRDEDKWNKAIFWVFDVPSLAKKTFEV